MSHLLQAGVLIVGNGFLGHAIGLHHGWAIYPDRITDRIQLTRVIKQYGCHTIINAAGKTGRPNIDWCETHQKQTYHSNVELPLLLAQVCADQGLLMYHLGSGCVYQGDNDGLGFSETDEPNFMGSYYSRTKVLAERELNQFGNVCQLRLRMPIAATWSPRDFITKITGYRKVISVANSMTYVPDLLTVVGKLVEARATGLWNVVNPGIITQGEILDLYRQYQNPDHTWEPITPAVLDQFTEAPRSNCILNTAKLEQLIKLPFIKHRVIQTLQTRPTRVGASL